MVIGSRERKSLDGHFIKDWGKYVSVKILIVGQYYYPDNFRINDISKEFAQRGHRVTVLTGLPDYTTGKVPWKYKFFRRRREVVDGVDRYSGSIMLDAPVSYLEPSII